MSTADVVRLYRFLATSDHPVARTARAVRKGVQTFSVPVPKPIAVPMQYARLATSSAFHFGKRVLVAEPIFKSYCKSYGERLRTDSAVHYVTGRGDIVIGDDVMLDGCIGIHFASRYSDVPSLTIGSRTGIGHNSILTIGKSITIGSDCRIASDVLIYDSSGHPADPTARLAGSAASPDEVRPVVIEDNVWIGIRAIISPGVTIGQGSVVSAASVVLSDVPPYTVVAGNPARRIAALTPISGQDTIGRLTRRIGKRSDPVKEEDTVIEPNTTEKSEIHKVISMIERVGKLSGLRPDQDVYTAGFSSVRTLELLLEIEDEFAIAIPDDGRFPAARTAKAIHDLVESLRR